MHSRVGDNFRAASQDVPNYRFSRTAARQILSDWYQYDTEAVTPAKLIQILQHPNISLNPLALELQRKTEGKLGNNMVDHPLRTSSNEDHIQAKAINHPRASSSSQEDIDSGDE